MFCLKLETDHHRSRRTKLRNIDQFISERLRHICVQDSEREMNDLAKGWYYHFILDWGTEKWRKLSLLPGAVVVVCELWGETCEDQRLERWEWCSQAQFSQNIVRWDEGNSEHTNIFFAESPEPGLATLLIQLVQNCLIEKLNSSGAWCVSRNVGIIQRPSSLTESGLTAAAGRKSSVQIGPLSSVLLSLILRPAPHIPPLNTAHTASSDHIKADWEQKYFRTSLSWLLQRVCQASL